MTILSGADNTSGEWETFNETNPFVDDTEKWIEFSYEIEATGDLLPFGQVVAAFTELNGTSIPSTN